MFWKLTNTVLLKNRPSVDQAFNELSKFLTQDIAQGRDATGRIPGAKGA
jgi:hypothetical protein